MPSLITRIRQQPAWIALAIFIFLCIWVASGSLSAAPEGEIQSSTEAPVPKVRVTPMSADPVNRQITLYGRTGPDRMAMLRAEVTGQVTGVFVQEGQAVKEGERLLTLDVNDLEQRLNSARAMLKQREIELEGAKSLGQKGYQSQVNLAQASANLEMAKAEVQSLRLALDNTQIIAPFAGIVNERFVEIGDLLRVGDEIATLVDLDPLVINADVTETQVQQLEVGQAANGRLASGQAFAGEIRYISSLSNQGTNTFRIEIQVPNADRAYVAGMSAELGIPLQQTWAIKVTPAVMALDEQGNLGVKTVVDEHVRFVPIDIVKSESDGVWLAGLGRRADVITLGHGFVRDGDRVEAVSADHQLQAKK